MKKMNSSKWHNLSFKSKNILLIILCFLLLSISTIGYSALNSKLNITGDLVLRSIKDIRITSLELVESVNGGYEYYNSKYSNDSVTISSSLPNKGSSITYEVTIENRGNIDMTISSIDTSTSDNIATLSIDGIEVEDIIPYNNSKTFRITIEKTVNSDIKEISGLLELTFTERLKEPNFCLDNGFNKLADCILVMDTKNTNLEETKGIIEGRVANFNQIAPDITYKEKIQLNVTGSKLKVVEAANSNVYFSTEKPLFDKKKNDYIFNQETSFKGIIEDYISNDTTKYYTCFSGDINCYNADVYVIYEYTSLEDNNINYYWITKADRYTHEIDSIDSSTSGIYSALDDYGTSYYYRGDIKNNWVSFAGYLWRIVRINGDGSIRLIYSGSSSSDIGTKLSIYNKNFPFSEEESNPAFVGYKYGLDLVRVDTEKQKQLIIGNNYSFFDEYSCDDNDKKCLLKGNKINGKWSEISEQILNGNEQNGGKPYKYSCLTTSKVDNCQTVVEILEYVNNSYANVKYHGYISKNYESTYTDEYDSSVKKIVDGWYEENLLNVSDENGIPYNNYLSDTLFCNDRSIYSGNGYSLNPTTIYGSRFRIDNFLPSLVCPRTEDEFTVENQTVNGVNIGNGELKYPIGLITVDEGLMAGGNTINLNSRYYLYSNTYIWTMSPYSFSFPRGHGYLIRTGGTIGSNNGLTITAAIRPVINLHSNIQITSGTGSSSSPFKITI